jgi:MscS family membrane protein
LEKHLFFNTSERKNQMDRERMLDGILSRFPFLDDESRWIAWQVGFIVFGLLFTKCLDVGLRYFSKKYDSPSFKLLADAVRLPAICVIWYFVALYTIDLLTEDWLSESNPGFWTILANGGSVLFLGWFLLRLKDRVLGHMMKQRALEGQPIGEASVQGLSKIGTIVIGIILLILLNDFTGVSLSTLLAFGGVGGLALAVASQEIVSNFFGGLMIHLTHPFQIGEYVQIPSLNMEGSVEEVGWYQTRIRPLSKEAVFAPNSLFTKTLLINQTRITHRLLNEKIRVKATSLDSLSLIIQDIGALFSSNPKFDHAEWSGARIESIGPISTLVLTALTKANTLQEFYSLRDEVFLQVARIIASRGGTIAICVPQAVEVAT